MNATVIATHLNATEILEIREWATVLWVKAVRAGKTICRFVSNLLAHARRAKVSPEVAAMILSEKIEGKIWTKKAGEARIYIPTGYLLFKKGEEQISYYAKWHLRHSSDMFRLSKETWGEINAFNAEYEIV